MKFQVLWRIKPERYEGIWLKLFDDNEWKLHRTYATEKDRDQGLKTLQKRDTMFEYKSNNS